MVQQTFEYDEVKGYIDQVRQSYSYIPSVPFAAMVEGLLRVVVFVTPRPLKLILEVSHTIQKRFMSGRKLWLNLS